MSPMCERWLPVSGFAPYEVSDQGRVRRGFRYVKPWGATNGYKKVSLSCGGVVTKHYVHRLVLLAFVGPAPEGSNDCAHANGCRHDNSLDNLRWASRSENMADAEKHGTKAKGERCGTAILTETEVLHIRQLRGKGLTQQGIADMFGISRGAVCDIDRRVNWGWLA